MKGGLADKFAQFQSDAQRREESHAQNRNAWRVDNEQIGKFDNKQIEESLRGEDYVPQLNAVSAIPAATYKRLEKEKEKDEDRFVTAKKEEQMEHTLREAVKQLMDGAEWQRPRMQSWTEQLLHTTATLLDKYLKDGIGLYKYAIDVHILKATAIARQSDTLRAASDYSINLKVKTGNKGSIIVLLNCHAFRVA